MALTESDIKIIIAAELKKKGFKDAEKATGALDKQFKQLGKTVLAFFSAREVISFGKAAVKAFSDDEVAANRFAMALKNVNLGFATPEIERYLETLEKQTAVTKGELRPAFQQLATTTRSLAMSEDILNTALDVSAGTGEKLETVVSDLSKSFLGNNASLSKYQLGLSKAELKTKSFSEIQDLLNKQFSGQRAAYLDTYAGKVSMLEASYERMQTSVGSGLIDAFSMLAGESGIGGATTAMERFGVVAADVIRGVGVAVSEVASRIPFFDKIFDTSNIPVIGAYIDMFRALGEPKRPLFFPTAGIGQPAVDARLKAIEEAAIKRQKELEALRLKSLRAQEKANRLKRISIMLMEKEKKFDLTKIQLQAALQGKLTAEEEARIKELMKIEEIKEAVAAGDADRAEKLMDELKELQSETVKLANMLTEFPKASNPFDDWEASITNIISGLGMVKTMTLSQAVSKGLLVPTNEGYQDPGTAPNAANYPDTIEGQTQLALDTAAHAEAMAAASEAALAEAIAQESYFALGGVLGVPRDELQAGLGQSSSGNTININVSGALDPYAVARQIAEVIDLEATTSGSFGALGYSRAFGIA